MPTPFEFDPNLSTQDNINKFLGYLEGQEPQLTAILRTATEAVLPLPQAAAQRTTKRLTANKGVLASLEALPPQVQ